MSDEPTRLLRLAEVAKLFQVHPKTVYYWFRTGRLSGVSSPGRLIRVRPADIVEMCRASGTPIPEGIAGTRLHAYFVEGSKGTLAGFARVAKRSGFEVHTFAHPYDAILAVGEMPPSAIVVEVTEEGLAIDDLVAALHRRPSTKKTRVFAIASSPTTLERLRATGADGIFAIEDVAEFRAALEG